MYSGLARQTAGCSGVAEQVYVCTEYQKRNEIVAE